MNKFKTISLFCGAGGLDMGFERAGFETIWANDFNSDACETHKEWSKARTVCGDISKIDETEIPDADVVLGGFPCQGFSLSGPRKLDDSRNTLYKQFVRIVKAKQPYMFVAENVKGLLSMDGGKIIEAIISEFSDCGYNVYYKLLNAKNYGVPEDRERVIIVGFKKDLNIENLDFPEPNSSFITLKDVLKDIPEPKEEDICRQPYSSRYMSRNRKRGWDDVSYTIPAMAKQVPIWPGSPDMKKLEQDKWEFGDSEKTRRLSWQEAAAIQTFPSDLNFHGNLISKYKQIGNAVPVKLAETIANHLYDILTASIRKNFKI
ncbi:DNA cytosine methyltransferase [Frisingicoccus sp.]|uniref:DNA cytosine methyltransferase n=1 Tax=Frisingicoccus sp. TaxID=1918627 RepID=UPI00399B37C5